MVESILVSSKIISLLLVPVLREIASILLAIAISKDCNARNNGSGALWGLFTLIAPITAGIIYCVYSRFLVKRNPQTAEDKKRVRSSYKLTIASGFVLFITIIVAIVVFVTGAASGVATIIKNWDKIDKMVLDPQYYDMNGVEYSDGEDVLLYDKNGNSYHIEESPNGWNYFTYFDQNGKEYDREFCFISKDGYFYYDKDSKLKQSDDWYYYDKTFYDENNNEYKFVGNYAFFDAEGKIIINHIGYRGGTVNEYAFE